MSVNFLVFVLSVLGMIAFTSAYAGEYIPKSYYIISNGHQSEPVYLRSKRSLLHLLRAKRDGSYSQAGITHGAPPFGGGIPSPEEFFAFGQDFLRKLPYMAHGPDFAYPDAFNQIGGIPRGGGAGGSGYGGGSSGGGSYSFAGAYGSGAGAGAGYPQGTYTRSGGQPASGHHYSNTGSNGPQVFSRSGEDTGKGVYVSGSATGPNGAFSSTSAVATPDGKVRYSVKNVKY